MGVFRRPELEKDNPVAPQMYVGPRRRRALARAAAKAPSRKDRIAETLQAVTVAAERFIDSVPVSMESQKERAALLKAIAQAQSVLADGDRDEAAAAE